MPEPKKRERASIWVKPKTLKRFEKLKRRVGRLYPAFGPATSTHALEFLLDFYDARTKDRG